ncbi:MAG: DUF429 domain-containing protein [Acidobacteria bacterium]|nr:DUF429 domain-containing protein [Acidobacteriota bacterium]
MTFVGIDGCRGGWIVACSDEKFGTVEFDVVADLAGVFSQSGKATLIAIDIPIGLSPAAPRRCDTEARRFLTIRGSSVFPVPVRSALAAAAANRYREACDLNFAACGRRLSKQSHGILRKIAEVDALMSPRLQPFIRESHPEIALALMNGAMAVVPGKKTLEGRRERMRLLKQQGVRINANRLERERRRFGASTVALDDLIDALACMTIARKIAEGRAVRFPVSGVEARDERGLLMEIWG